MIQEHAPIRTVKEIGLNIFQLSFLSSSISLSALPGQFVNVKVEDSAVPLLRRPFSIFSVERETVSIIFNVIGLGTKLLSQKKPGETLDVLGPLGKGVFPDNDKAVKTALLVAGGLGVAAFPFLNSRLRKTKTVVSFLGARTSSNVVRIGLDNIHIATDDGSEGLHGTVVDLLKNFLNEHPIDGPRIYTCGPTAMMREVAKVSREKNIPCSVALECEMACGIGLCQGCPVETVNHEKKYRLVCKDGPVFEASEIRF
ncbi:MAG: dihydroorotate dehydrogenase electron transfer subunit [Bacteroidota bacterium]